MTLQSSTETVDATTGAVRRDYSTVKTLRCAIEPLRGRELLIGRAEEAQMSHRLMFRYDAAIVPQSRLLYTDRAGNEHVLDIESVANLNEANQRMEVMALERQKVT